MVTIIHALIFISIVLESLPISSSTHVYLLTHWFFQSFIDHHRLLQSIELLTHGWYIVVLGFFFRKKWKYYILGFPRSLPICAKIIWQGFIVESLTVLFYVMVYGLFHIVPSLLAIFWGLCVTTLSLYSLRMIAHNRNNHWNVMNSLKLGIAQGIALLPGISRFAITFSSARWCGIRPQRAFELSFLIAAPINLAACILGFYRLTIYQPCYLLHGSMVIFMLIASVGMYVGLLIVRKLIQKNILWLCSLYTAALALGIMLIFIVG